MASKSVLTHRFVGEVSEVKKMIDAILSGFNPDECVEVKITIKVRERRVPRGLMRTPRNSQ